jgi:hypothetical protein
VGEGLTVNIYAQSVEATVRRYVIPLIDKV